jgi:hypothetical protein
MATKRDDGIAVIQPPNLVRISVRIEGATPYVQNAFSKKARDKMLADMATPKAERKSKTARPPRNYDDDFAQAQHRAVEGWIGIPASAFRAGMIDACRTANIVMTRAKLALKIVADGFDAADGSPLVKLQSPRPPERTEMLVRNDNGSADIRIRPMWRQWAADLTIEFDADMITAESVVNLLDRTGRQVGIGEGRNFSKNSVGMGWGEFAVVTTAKEVAA